MAVTWRTGFRCRRPLLLEASKHLTMGMHVVQDVRRALKALEQAVQSSPWLLSDNFVSSMVDKKGHLALVGPGDPTGKGRGFSFTKDPRRVSLD